MQLENEQVVGDVIKRLRRAEGQLAGVIRMMEAGRLRGRGHPARRGLPRARQGRLAIIATGLEQCISAGNDGSTLDRARLEKLSSPWPEPAPAGPPYVSGRRSRPPPLPSSLDPAPGT